MDGKSRAGQTGWQPPHLAPDPAVFDHAFPVFMQQKPTKGQKKPNTGRQQSEEGQ